MVKRFARLLSVLSAFFGLWLLVRSPKGRLGGLVWLPKLWAGAWAPFLTIAGALGALLGIASGDAKSALAGSFGAYAASRYTGRVTHQPDRFVETFGQDWEQEIRPGLWVRSEQPYLWLQPPRPLLRGQRNIDLGNPAVNGKPLLCDLWTPAEPSQIAGMGIVYLHGSLWQALDKDFLTRSLFGRLTHQGHTVMDLAYSLAPEATLPQMLGEVKHAVAWFKTHALEYNLDPDRIVLMGHSGGGHLALLAAYTPNDPAFQSAGLRSNTSVRAVVSLYGPTDLEVFFEEYGALNPAQPEYSAQITPALRPRVYARNRFENWLTQARIFPAYRHANLPGGPLLLVELLGGTLKEVPEAYHRFSPINHVGPRCPATLQIFGDDDFIIHPSHGRRLHRALQDAGVPSVYIELPDTVHGFDQYFGVSRRVAPAAQVAASRIEQFLALMA